MSFVLHHRASHDKARALVEAEQALHDTIAYWREWSGRGTYRGAGKPRSCVR